MTEGIICICLPLLKHIFDRVCGVNNSKYQQLMVTTTSILFPFLPLFDVASIYNHLTHDGYVWKEPIQSTHKTRPLWHNSRILQYLIKYFRLYSKCSM